MAESSLAARSYLGSRLDTLRRAQNPDGGWGYFTGKQSWLEPTVYAALALAGESAADRAWTLLKGWQGKDGSWRPSIDVAVENFGTSLCVSLAIARGETDPAADQAVDRGVEWLLGSAGAESIWVNRLVARAGLIEADRNVNLKGWPWKPGTSSWVEPTAHALVALKKYAAQDAAAKIHAPANIHAKDLLDRVRLGQAQLMDVRCRDFGWNYGSREALKVDLPSYPDTTGIALVGLQGRSGLDSALDYAAYEVGKTVSPLGRAWLTIALRLHGRTVPETPSKLQPPPDLQILALEAIAAPDGNYHAFKTEALA